MKRIYFVRHGQSEGNIGLIRQHSSTALTDLGRKQANLVADRLSTYPIETIISSTMSRAQETAQIIANRINKEIEFSDLFVERRRPSEQIGKPKDDLIALESQRLIEENFLTPDYYYSDEENFTDLKNRASQMLNFVAERPEENILVVGHGYIMRLVLAYAICGPNLSALEGQKFINALKTNNTGMTIFDYNPESAHPWQVLVWNDHAHLEGLVE